MAKQSTTRNDTEHLTANKANQNRLSAATKQIQDGKAAKPAIKKPVRSAKKPAPSAALVKKVQSMDKNYFSNEGRDEKWVGENVRRMSTLLRDPKNVLTTSAFMKLSRLSQATYLATHKARVESLKQKPTENKEVGELPEWMRLFTNSRYAVSTTSMSENDKLEYAKKWSALVQGGFEESLLVVHVHYREASFNAAKTLHAYDAAAKNAARFRTLETLSEKPSALMQEMALQSRLVEAKALNDKLNAEFIYVHATAIENISQLISSNLYADNVVDMSLINETATKQLATFRAIVVQIATFYALGAIPNISMRDLKSEIVMLKELEAILISALHGNRCPDCGHHH